MKYVVAAFALSLLSTPVLAQATTQPPASPTTSSSTDQGSAAAKSGLEAHANRTGRGAYIKMEGRDGAEITVRCADGETTRACADVVTQLLDKARSGAADRRGSSDRGSDMDHRGDNDRDDHRGFRSRERDY